MPTATAQTPTLEVFQLQTGEEPGPFMAPHLRPLPGLWTIKRRPVFAVGEWNGDLYTPEDLAYHEKAFPHYVRDARPWVTINHTPEGELAGLIRDVPESRGIAAVLGHVAAFYRNRVPYHTAYGEIFEPGHLMLADLVNVPDLLKKSIERRNFARASVGFEAGFVGNDGQNYPWILQHISFQGAEPEAVFTLDDLDRLYGRPQQTTNAEACRFFTAESRAAGSRSGARKIVTFSLNGVTPMAFTPEEENRISNIEAGISQLMEAVQGLVAKMDSAPADAPVENGAQFSDDSPPTDSADVSTPAQDAEPAPVAEPEASVDVVEEETPETPETPEASTEDDEKVVEIEKLRQESAAKDAALATLEQRILKLEEAAEKKAANFRRESVKQFVKSRSQPHNMKIPALIAPLAENILIRAAELEAMVPGGKLKTFSKGGKDHGFLESLMLFVDSHRAAGEAIEGTSLDDLANPPSMDSVPSEWNKETVNAQVKEYARRNKVGEDKALKECVKVYGSEFLRGLSRAPTGR